MSEKQVKQGKRLYSVTEAAIYLGIAARTIYNRIGAKSSNPFPVRPVRVATAGCGERGDKDQYVACSHWQVTPSSRCR